MNVPPTDALSAPVPTSFDALPAGARVWVFAGNRPIEASDRERITEVMARVLQAWKSKAPMAKGCFEFREDRFFIVGSDESGECLSGCSIDAMVQWMMQLEQQVGLKLVDRMAVHYRRADGVVDTVSRAEFKNLAAAGDVTPETPVFDTIISRVESLRDGQFEIPLSGSWHAQLIG